MQQDHLSLLLYVGNDFSNTSWPEFYHQNASKKPTISKEVVGFFLFKQLYDDASRVPHRKERQRMR